jgi:hypothetical protein
VQVGLRREAAGGGRAVAECEGVGWMRLQLLSLLQDDDAQWTLAAQQAAASALLQLCPQAASEDTTDMR